MFSRSKGAPAKTGKGGPPGLSFIGPEVTVSGNIATTAQLHVDGCVKGDVQCEALCQGESGIIAGNIVAGQIRLAGLVDGTVMAKTVTLESTARVTGDVSYEILSIAAGARIDGRLARKESAAPADEAPKLIATPLKPAPAEDSKAHELFPRSQGAKAIAAG